MSSNILSPEETLHNDLNIMRQAITKTIKRHIWQESVLKPLDYLHACKQLSWHLGYNGDKVIQSLPLNLPVATAKSDVTILTHWIRAYIAALAKIRIPILIEKGNAPVIGNLVTVGPNRPTIALGKNQLFQAMLNLTDGNDLILEQTANPLTVISASLVRLEKGVEKLTALIYQLKGE